MGDQRDVALGIAVSGVRTGMAAGRIVLLPVRVAARVPGVGRPLRRVGRDLAHRGELAGARARGDVEAAVAKALASPELERSLDRALTSVLDHALTERAVDRILESREMDRIVGYIATSPQVLAAVSSQTQSLAQEMVTSVRERTETVDDVAERTVRAWLRRPRVEPT
jgi:hypothetical protein